MSVGRLGKATNWADDTYGNKVLDERYAQWGEIPGKIVEFDEKKQTAKVKPLYKPKINGKSVEMPELFDIPVRFPRAGKAAITYPVAKDDRVTLRPQMRSTQEFHEKDDTFEASDARSFNPADYEAHLAGGEGLKNPIKNFDKSNLHIRFDEEGQYGLKGNKDGKWRLDGNQGNFIDLITQVVELLGQDLLKINYGSSTGSGHELLFKAQYQAIGAKLRAMTLSGS